MRLDSANHAKIAESTQNLGQNINISQNLVLDSARTTEFSVDSATLKGNLC